MMYGRAEDVKIRNESIRGTAQVGNLETKSERRG